MHGMVFLLRTFYLANCRHGRDNKICVWRMPSEQVPAALTSSLAKDLPEPTLVLTLDVNALNYCAYDMTVQACTQDGLKGWVAVPHTLESAWIDVYELPSKRRIVEALGRQDVLRTGAERPAIVMALQCCRTNDGHTLCAGYEDGTIQAWTFDYDWTPTLLWTHKPHAESVMALALAPDRTYVVSVGADRALVQTALLADALPRSYDATRPGHASVAIDARGHTMAVGCWSSKTHLYTLPSMSKTMTLPYHKEGIYAVAYSRYGPTHTLAVHQNDSDCSSEDDQNSTKAPTHEILACGSKDGRVSLWNIPTTGPDER